MTEMVYREALKAGLREEMLRDERVFLLGEDIGLNWGGAFKVTKGLAEEFGVKTKNQSDASIIKALAPKMLSEFGKYEGHITMAKRAPERQKEIWKKLKNQLKKK